MKKGFLVLCALFCSQVVLAADMGNFGLNFLSVDFAAPVVFNRSSISSPQAGTIVYDTSSAAFFGLPPGANPSGSWVQLSATSGSGFHASSQITTSSSSISASTFATFSNSPAFTFTPTVGGSYKIYTSAAVAIVTNGTQGVIRVFNTSGSATLLQESQAIDIGDNGTESSLYTQSVYTLTAGVSYQFDIQGKVVAGNSIILDGTVAPFYMFAEILN